jgi:hypothetical protein
VADAETEPEALTVDDVDAVAPSVTDAVADEEVDPEALAVDDVDAEAPALGDLVADADVLLDGDTAAVALPAKADWVVGKLPPRFQPSVLLPPSRPGPSLEDLVRPPARNRT